jgi:hypothetical protein
VHKRCDILAVIIITLALVLTIAGCDQVPPTTEEDIVVEAWVARYDGQTADDDGGQALALDGSGNIYITGYSWGANTSSDFATMKYDTDGNQLWVARYNGPANHADWALGITLDVQDNVYVTGWSQGNGTEEDYTAIKYDSVGNQLWVARYDGPVSGHDLAYDIAVDYSGDVYITGWSQGNVTEADYATIKFDNNGNQLWVTRYDGPVSDEDKSYAIAVDAWANVYVTGWSQGNGTGADYATIKYDSDGNQLWVARYNGPVSGDDNSNNIAIDNWGNVYVTGWSTGNGTKEDYATIKYDHNGALLWVARYNGPAGGEDKPFAMAIDSWNNIYVCGWSQGNGTDMDYVTVKYDADGNRLWAARYDGPVNGEDCASSIDIDGFGNIYVSGWSRGEGIRYDYATVKYDADGNQLWVTRYDGPARGHDKVYAIAVDSVGNTYVTGRSSGNTTYYDYTTIKYIQ